MRDDFKVTLDASLCALSGRLDGKPRQFQMQMSIDLQEWFGGIDIYIFDPLLKGRFVPGMRVLDAGCGSGRNLVYFLRSGYEVFGVDESLEAISQVSKPIADCQLPIAD